jgi:hypothetical protein
MSWPAVAAIWIGINLAFVALAIRRGNLRSTGKGFPRTTHNGPARTGGGSAFNGASAVSSLRFHK